jgi:putative ABC transport system ATP-binding protein
MPAPLIDISNLSKMYTMGSKSLEVLKGLSLCVNQGEFLAIMGPSGSGKSTLLNILGCLDRLTAGTYLLDGVDVSHATDDKLSAIRSTVFGFVFQNFNLIHNLNVYDNVSMPFLYTKSSKNDIHSKTLNAIENVGLTKRIHHNPHELSGGEMQRVAIARALVNQPKIIIADEPTGNLDSVTGSAIMELIRELNRKGTTLILVTHDENIASWSKSMQILKDGKFI